jgi:hypothetical protein
MDQVLATAGAILAIGGALVLLRKTIHATWQAVRAVVRLTDDLAGRPPRFPGDPDAHPGLAQRLTRIDDRLDGLDQRLGTVEGQLVPNGGSSLHDQVRQIRAAIAPDS